MSARHLAVDTLAAARLTRLVTTDTITAPLREKLIRWAYRSQPEMAPSWGGIHPWAELARVDDGDPPWPAKLVTCDWCAGVWVGFGVAVARLIAPGPWALIARGLAIAQASAIVASQVRPVAVSTPGRSDG